MLMKVSSYILDRLHYVFLGYTVNVAGDEARAGSQALWQSAESSPQTTWREAQ